MTQLIGLRYPRDVRNAPIRTALACLILASTVGAPPGHADVTLIPPRRLTVKSLASGDRKIAFSGKMLSEFGLPGSDPHLAGATFHLKLEPGGTQCFTMPASGWSPEGIYKDAPGLNGPVRVAMFKAPPGGMLRIKVAVRGTNVMVGPGNPTMAYGLNFMVRRQLPYTSHAEYCAGADVIMTRRNDEKVFALRPGGSSCDMPSCGSPSAAFVDVRTPASF